MSETPDDDGHCYSPPINMCTVTGQVTRVIKGELISGTPDPRDARIAELVSALKQARDHINYGLEHKTDVQNILDRIDRALDPELE